MPEPLQQILVVEDNEDDAALLMADLSRLDRPLAFRRVETAEEMAAALAERPWDLVISDHQLPRFDSTTALQTLRGSGSDAPFIIMSGTLGESAAAKAMRLGVQDFIDKSNRVRLLPVVERELRNASLRRIKRDIEKSLVHLTYHDPLTGLANRDLVNRMIEHAAEGAGPSRGLGLVLLDIDRFRRINDSLGHAAGDRLLVAVASRLAALYGEQATVGRLSEDTFALLFTGVADATEVLRHADGVMRAFADVFRVGGEELSVTACAGVALYPGDEADPGELVPAAERAMHDAKLAGPGSVRRCQGTRAPRLATTVRLEGALRQAAARDEFFLLYQPLVATATRRIAGAEALIRWRHPQLGMLSPDRFLPLAEELGMQNEIGRFVLDAATQQARRWIEDDVPGLRIAVNVSPSQFRRSEFADEVMNALAASGLSGERLELEITETAVMQDANAAIDALRRLKAIGVSISIDDFGTGYSSLSYLRRLPIDLLKIDRSFLADVGVNADNQAIVRTIVALAKTLRLETVAEGVETVEQFELLADLEVDRVQGYLFGPPGHSATVARLATDPSPVPFIEVVSAAAVAVAA